MSDLSALPAVALEPLGYTIAQAGIVMSCSRSFLFREITAGRLRATKHGSKVIISRQAILEFLGDVPAPTGIVA